MKPGTIDFLKLSIGIDQSTVTEDDLKDICGTVCEAYSEFGK